MIGVISKKHQQAIVEEFFQLFKTPWDFYDKTRYYGVVLTTENEIADVDANLLLIYGSEEKRFDSSQHITQKHQGTGAFVEFGDIEVPIYGKVTAFEGTGRPLLRLKGNGRIVGLEIQTSNLTALRLGYDLFEEICFLLTVGQPPENAHIPTLELHILMLRKWILDVGIPLIEIPPVPAGYSFITCLTHDVDFVGIRNHFFDHTMWGFLYRAIFGSLFAALKRKTCWSSLLINWKAALSLPFVYLGFSRDFWFQFDRYLEIERDVRSTFFLIPFKNRAGNKVPKRSAKRRAMKYDITEVQNSVKNLLNSGFEVGAHGIDAWCNPDLGRHELNRISQATGQSKIGVRIHWLYFNEDSPQLLEQAGFSYDSSFGYNDAVGYRAGTLQAFRPQGAQNILELPLHIQDTVLFSHRRMNLSEIEAWNLCKELIKNATISGGALTVLWHQRSLAPERLWGDFYIKVLDELRAHNVWFATAAQVIEWFRKRRSLTFEEVRFNENSVQLKLKNAGDDSQPRIMLRIHHKNIRESGNATTPSTIKNHVDIPFRGEGNMEISFSGLTKSI